MHKYKNRVGHVATFLSFLFLFVFMGCGEGSTSADNGPLAIDDTASETMSPNSERQASDDGAGQESVTENIEGTQNNVQTSSVEFMPLSDGGDVVSFVDIDRYMGRWYEIASTPSFQQRSCSKTEANYTFNEEEGWVDVVNKCYVGGVDGRLQQIQGRAEVVDTDTQAKLTVIFFGQRAPYWVVALDGSTGDEPYQWAVVSVPGAQTLWLLARTPEFSEQDRAEIDRHLSERGFEPEALIDTLHAPVL